LYDVGERQVLFLATWITHLRVAGKLYEAFPQLDGEAFMVGNIAPDSGEPNEDWSSFTPSTEVSHFDEGYHRFSGAERFAGQYLQKEQRAKYDLQELSFYTGYWCHLMTDALWRKNIVLPSQEKFSFLFENDPKGAFGVLKKDWYDLDFLFLKHNPGFDAWRIYSGAEGFCNRYLNFFSESAFENKRRYITGFYGAGRDGLEREYPYLDQATVEWFVKETVRNTREGLFGNLR